MGLRRKSRLLLLVLCVSMLLNGCQLAGRKVVFTTGLGNKDVFKIGDSVCSLSEAKVYLCNYQNIYGSAYGLNLWAEKSSKTKLEKYIKEMTVSELARITCMDMLAEEQGVSITEEEKKNISEAAKAYYNSLTKEEIAYMGVTETTIVSLYENYALADKLYTSLTEGVNEEVSDDEARIMHAQQIYVKNADVANQIAARLAAGDDFASLASEYNEASDIEITFGRNDVPKEVEQVVFSLEDDQISDCISTDTGFYFIKCENKYDEELTQENKIAIAQEREKTAFNDAYNAFVEKQDSMINQKMWDEVKVDTSENISTNSFFTVYEQYCN